MKIIINFGFVLIIMVILFIGVMAIGEMRHGGEYQNQFSIGFLVGMLLVAGVFMLNHGIKYDTKKHKWEEY